MSSMNNDLKVTTIISPVTCNIGDIATYMIQITVPQGVIAYNIQTTVSYPVKDQTIISESFMRDEMPLSIQPTIKENEIQIPAIPEIDATNEEINTVYTFKTKVINAIMTNVNGQGSSSYTDEQQSEVIVKWSNNQSIFYNDTVKNTAILNVQLEDIVIDYKHQNITQKGTLTRNPLNFNIGDIIEYQIIASNNGVASATNIVLKDQIGNVLKINSNSFVASAGTFEVSSTNQVTWAIPVLKPKQIMYLNFSVEVLPTVSMDQLIEGIVIGTCMNGNIESTIFPSNTLLGSSAGADFTVTTGSNTAILGGNIEYTLKIVIPPNIIVKNLKVYDLLPPNQQYVNATLTQQINSEPITNLIPQVSIKEGTTQQIIKIPQVTSWGSPGTVNTVQSSTLIYKFKAKVTALSVGYPYTTTVTNIGYMSWEVGEGSNIQTYGDEQQCNITINEPNLIMFKEQEPQGGVNNSYVQSEIFVSRGETINYKLTVSNTGSSTAYNVVITDKLQPCFLFKSNILVPNVGSVSVPTIGTNGTITWSIDEIAPEAKVEYIYSVTISDSVKLKQSFVDTSIAQYNTVNGGDQQISTTSNELLIIINGVELQYTSNENTVVFNQVIKYSIIVTIPQGVTVYNLKVLCMISYMETYNSGSWTSSLNNVTGNSNPA